MREKFESEVGSLRAEMWSGFAGVYRRIDDLAEKIVNWEERPVKLEKKVFQQALRYPNCGE